MGPAEPIQLPATWVTKPVSAGAEPSSLGVAEADTGRPSEGASEQGPEERRAQGCRRRYSPEERFRILAELDASGQTIAGFARTHEVSAATLHAWRRGSGAGKGRTRHGARKQGRHFTPDERRRTIEAFRQAGVSQVAFAKVWGVSSSTLGKWLRAYAEGGPKALEPKAPKPGDRRLGRRVPKETIQEIEATKRRFPSFGLRKVRDYVARFGGRKVSLGSVQRTLEDAGLEMLPKTAPRPKRKKQPPRRFERALPGQLWQTDITSFHLPRDSRRVYLVVFLDDASRYIVSWNLACHHKSAFVIEALQDGMSRYGRPEEILTDQGRQYFAWRGKSAFTKLLEREGIGHVVSRAHHPQTLGKCERLWLTVGQEFWERAHPLNLGDARTRFAHWVSHYNFFRTHQGLDGLVPADRFFGAEDAVRKTLEEGLCEDELSLALDEAPRQRLYLFGQVGSQQIALAGEEGRVVVHTPGGGRQELALDGLGAGVAASGGDAGADHDEDQQPMNHAAAKAADEETQDAAREDEREREPGSGDAQQRASIAPFGAGLDDGARAQRRAGGAVPADGEAPGVAFGAGL